MIAPIDYTPTTEGILLLGLGLQRIFELDQVLISNTSTIFPLEIARVGRYCSQLLMSPKLWELKLAAANSIMDMNGIEPLIVGNKAIATYVNTGESYRATVLYDHAKQVFVVTSWGDFLDSWEVANLIEVSLESVAGDIHDISHYPFEWEECTEGSVEDYDCVQDWLDSASIDIRLRVTEDHGYEVLHGLPDFDPTHRGAWGSSSVGKCQTFEDCRTIARDLIGQAADSIHLSKTITLIED